MESEVWLLKLRPSEAFLRPFQGLYKVFTNFGTSYSGFNFLIFSLFWTYFKNWSTKVCFEWLLKWNKYAKWYGTNNLNACFNGCTIVIKTSMTAMSFVVVFSTFRIKLVENPCSSSFENINIYIFPIQIRQTQRCFLEKILKNSWQSSNFWCR